MKKWYKTNVAKVILIVVAVITAVTAMGSAAWYVDNLPSMSELVPGEQPGKYEDSKAFDESLSNSAHHILQNVDLEKNAFGDSGYKEDELVDIKDYHDNGNISGKNESGFAFKIGDLMKWYQSDEYNEWYYSYDNNYETAVVVCKKPDGGYHYFKYDDFRKKISDEDLTIDSSDYGNSEEWDEDNLTSYLSSHEDTPIINTKNEVVYNSCWFFDDMVISGDYQPAGADSILDIANNDEDWNGRLEDMYDMLSYTIGDIGSSVGNYEAVKNTYHEGDSNLTYIYADTKAKKLYTNSSKYTDYDKLDEYMSELKSQKYVSTSSRIEDFDSNIKEASANTWTKSVKGIVDDSEDEFIFIAAVDTSFPIEDSFAINAATYNSYVANADTYMEGFATSASLFLICVIWLCMIAGRRATDDELHINRFDKIKTEFAAAMIILVIIFFGWATAYGAIDLKSNLSSSNAMLISIVPLGALLTLSCLIGMLSLVRRIKAKRLWKDSILKIIVDTLIGLFRNISLLWKTILIFTGFVFIHWLAMEPSAGFTVFLALAAEVAALIYMIRTALGRVAIHRGIKEIASGNLDYKITSKHLRGEQLEIADRINTIGEGLDKAVAESMKSERMKTDLITNVSHDIKTPLTSIINYIGLLKNEHFTDPKIIRYLDILDEKAQRLKTLTEDVVEASKVSSGNIQLELVNINFVEMIQQTSGEFEEKLETRHLKEVLKLPDESVVIRADSKRTWRVLENIYNNTAKYAMPGTRVYSELEVQGEMAVFSLKNISEEELNITPDELTERFIRGDESRTKEGSGLGLSIAKSLTELQGGEFSLHLDGDLFKVVIKFPIIR